MARREVEFEAYNGYRDREGGDEGCCCPYGAGLHDYMETLFPGTDAVV